MQLLPMKELLLEAKANNSAVAAINVSNMETITGLLETAQKMESSIILQISPMQIQAQKITYAQIVEMIKLFGRDYDIKASIHVDHAVDVEDCYKAIDSGFTSVMYDGSMVDFDTNIENTLKVVNYAKGKNVTVEAELGKVGGAEASDSTEEGYMTDPGKVEIFVNRTGVDCLAVAIGNAHGQYKSKPKLDFNRLSAIYEKASIPLVLHGGTGIPDVDIKKAISKGIRKVNIFTEVDRAFVKGFVDAYTGNKNIYMMHAQEQAREYMMREIEKKLRICKNVEEE
ncbi:class II fructose-bisphosphate aldolase [Vallitalea guaymasensis]|uniref:class II fructose-bisphosphate aldolase n=1 Tax=Vallitalea guaymasensis TaxID=1185412 RepID=UPI002353442A|nr:class II fructose-bisphosphate aldolase [Vallitalea guaymasensis]